MKGEGLREGRGYNSGIIPVLASCCLLQLGKGKIHKNRGTKTPARSWGGAGEPLPPLPRAAHPLHQK